MAQTGLTGKQQSPPAQTVAFLAPDPGSARASDAAPGPTFAAAPPSAPRGCLGRRPPAANTPRHCAAVPRYTTAPAAPGSALPARSSSAPGPPRPPATSGTTARSRHSPRGNAAESGDVPDHAPAAPTKIGRAHV